MQTLGEKVALLIQRLGCMRGLLSAYHYWSNNRCSISGERVGPNSSTAVGGGDHLSSESHI